MHIAGHMFLSMIGLIGLLTGLGCQTAPKAPLATFEHKPLLIHLPGVAGDNFLARSFVAAVKRGGFDTETRIYNWTRKNTWIGNLQNYDTNRATASELAAEIMAIRAIEPNRPILLSCESGGAGPAIWTLEALPPGCQVDGVILLAPAMSPDYDLSKALSRVRGKLIAFHSKGDGFILGWGTRTWGTIDGKKVTAAGYAGFVQPEQPADADQYRKLESIAYDRAWFGKYGNAGDHTGGMGKGFASGYIAPLLVALAKDAETDRTQRAVHFTGQRIEDVNE